METDDGDGAVNRYFIPFLFENLCALNGWYCILVIMDCNMLIALHPPPSQCGVLPPYFCGIKCGVHDLRELLFYGIFYFVC